MNLRCREGDETRLSQPKYVCDLLIINLLKFMKHTINTYPIIQFFVFIKNTHKNKCLSYVSYNIRPRLPD